MFVYWRLWQWTSSSDWPSGCLHLSIPQSFMHEFCSYKSDLLSNELWNYVVYWRLWQWTSSQVWPLGCPALVHSTIFHAEILYPMNLICSFWDRKLWEMMICQAFPRRLRMYELAIFGLKKKRTARLEDCMHQFHLQGLSVQKNFADFVIDLISLFDICRHIEYIDISPWQILDYPKWRKIICKSCQSIVRASVSLWKNHKTGRTTHTELIAKASNNFFAAEKENLHFIAHFCSTWPIRHSLSLRIYCRQKSRILWCASFLRLLYANAKGLQLLIVLHAREGELNPCMSPCPMIWSHVRTPARLTPAIQ